MKISIRVETIIVEDGGSGYSKGQVIVTIEGGGGGGYVLTRDAEWDGASKWPIMNLLQTADLDQYPFAAATRT